MTEEEEEGEGGVIYDYDEELKKQWALELSHREEIASHNASAMSAKKKRTKNYNMNDPIDILSKKLYDLQAMLDNKDAIIAAKSASLSRQDDQRIKSKKTLELQDKLINSLK